MFTRVIANLGTSEISALLIAFTCEASVSLSEILIEFSFLTAPHNYLETIFQLQLKGYKVILAHAERYPYLSESDLEDFINRGVYLQLNILSSIGYYSNNVRERANWLIDNNMISFVGTDCHNLNQTKLYDKCKIEPMLSALLNSGKLLNDQLM